MADNVLDAEGSVATDRNGTGEHQVDAPSGATAAYQPLSKIRLRAALDAIPSDCDSEMLADFSRAVATQSREEMLKTIARWVGIGDFYADPDRVKNHPLASLAGVFKDDPEFEQFAEQIALARRQGRS